MPNQPGQRDVKRGGHQGKLSYRRGLKAERWAGWLMRAKGYTILHRRYKVRGGEIDLICRKRETIVFLEVKYRAEMEDALHSITPRNQSRIVTAATHFMASYNHTPVSTYRFDIMVFAEGWRPLPRWQHLESAFEAY